MLVFESPSWTAVVISNQCVSRPAKVKEMYVVKLDTLTQYVLNVLNRAMMDSNVQTCSAAPFFYDYCQENGKVVIY